MWHFVVCWRQYDTHSTRFWVEILKMRQLSFCILNVLHYSIFNDKWQYEIMSWHFEAKTVSWVFAFWTFVIVPLFSDNCRSLVRREWEWEGINSGNGTEVGIKSEVSWEWDWEWEWPDGNGREWECSKPFPHIFNCFVLSYSHYSYLLFVPPPSFFQSPVLHFPLSALPFSS